MKATLLQHIDQIPPALARLCARSEGRPKTFAEISSDSGIDINKVRRISRQPTWASVTVDEAMRFASACGLDLLRPRRKLFYLRRAIRPGDAGLKTLAGSLPISYVIRQINIVEEYESKQTKRDSANGDRGKKARARKVER